MDKGHRSRRRARAGVALLLGGVLIGVGGCGDGEPPEAPSPTEEQGPSPTRAASGRPSGLIWDSGSFGHSPEDVTTFERIRGHKIDVLAVAPTRDDWEQLLSSWWLGPQTIPASFEGTLNISVPLYPDDGNMARAAAGADNARWEQLGRMIHESYPDSYVRPGWEFNIRDWEWSANPDNVEQYKQAFRQAVTSLRKTAPNVRIVFNPNEGRGNTLPDATMAWPGDDVVDIVGIDAYDWHSPYTEEGWLEHKTKNQGWDFWGDFAREHGKKFAVPEWGVIAGSEDSGGDNPNYIDSVYGWMHANADIMAFETYFDESEPYCTCALRQNPKAKAAYQAWMPKLVAPESANSAPTGSPSGAPADGATAAVTSTRSREPSAQS